MITDTNPFQFGRYEHEADPAIYMPGRYCEFAKGTNFYIFGNRGSGKTAILRSLCYKDKIKVSSFRVDAAHFQEGRVLGMYTRISDLQLPRFNWLSNEPEIREFLFGSYFSFMHCQLLCDSLATLSANGYIPISTEDEMRFSEAFYSCFSDITELTRQSPYMYTFRSVKDTFQQLLEQVHVIALRPTSIEKISTPFLQPNKPRLDRFTDLLIDKVKLLSDWRFIICLDEAEVYVNWQQKIINSYVHGTKAPWSYLIAFQENMFEKEETATPNQKLSNSDRILKSLDTVKHKDYTEFADGVIRLRLSRAGHPNEEATLQSLVGKIHVNDLLALQLSESTQSAARILLADAEKNRSLFRVKEKTKSPPVYETWLMMREPKVTKQVELMKDALESRRISSGYIRKKHLVAYHNICKHFRFNPIYAGVDAVCGLSDRCVRDLLRMLYFMFTTMDSDRWLKADVKDQCYINVRTQSESIRNASVDKREKMSDEVVSYSDEVHMLIDNLGELFKTYQSDERSALEPDRGILRILCPSKVDGDVFLAIVKEAQFCGLINVHRAGSEMTIRLHTLLNPKYDLPSRKPSYSVTVNLALAKEFLLKKFDQRLAHLILNPRRPKVIVERQLFELPAEEQ
ncbi:MAG: ORC-CDC6 family AAA ATPase [Armatimonadota bacterium]